MRSTALRMLLAIAALAAVAPVSAQAPAEDCALPAAHDHPLGGRAEALAQFEQLPQQCLKDIVRQCTRAAGESVLDMGSAAACSFGYEALLRKGFGGNFQAMLAWWREESRVAAN